MRILFKNILLQILLFSVTSLVAQDIPQTEKDALLAFYNATNGDNWTNTVQNKGKWDFNTTVTSWNNTTQTGWFGIKVTNGHVVEINISSNNNLVGTIPNEIGNFPNLTLLGLVSNNLSGSIPDSIGNLNNLITLTINNANLSGSIPQSIGSLNQLQYFDLRNNKLEGEIPTSIGNLKKLTSLFLSINNLTGSIPIELSNLTLLKTLQIASNKLTGTIPTQIGLLTELIQLSFGYNLLTGSIPSEIGNLKKLQYLTLNNNTLTGAIPSSIGTITSLLKLDISSNNFNSTIPNSLGGLINLTSLTLNNSKLSGNIPTEIRNLSKLTTLTLNNNQLAGKIPDFTSLPLTSFNISNNKFRFIDFINEFPIYKGFVFNPQAKTDSPKTIVRHAGQSVTMEIFEDLRFHSGDTYQWFKNGVAIAGQIFRTLTISNVTTASAGTYTCKASHTTNPNIQWLVLEREPITLTVDNASYTCTNFSSSFTTTGVDGQPYRCGTIKVLPQLSNTDKIAEIKWTLTSPDGQTSFLSNQIIPNIEIAQYGKYRIDANIVDSNGCEKTIDHFSFDVFDCTVCDTNIPGEIVFTESNTYTCGRRDFTLSFSNPDNMSLTYEWKFYKADGTLWYTEEYLAAPQAFFNFYGTNRVELVIKNDQYKCQTRTLSINIPVLECKNTCPISGEIQLQDCGYQRTSQNCEYTCGDRTAYFVLNSEQTVYESSSYSWTFKNPSGQVIGTSNSRYQQIPFTFTTIGNNTVELTITNADGCPTVFTPLVVPVVSCCTPVVGEIKVYNNAHLRTTKPSTK